MVAALSCDMRPQYNATVKKYQHELVEHGQALKGMFHRTYGSRGERELNRFVTALANEASNRSLASGANYCSDAAALFADILEHRRSSLEAFWTTERADISPELLPGRVESAAR